MSPGCSLVRGGCGYVFALSYWQVIGTCFQEQVSQKPIHWMIDFREAIWKMEVLCLGLCPACVREVLNTTWTRAAFWVDTCVWGWRVEGHGRSAEIYDGAFSLLKGDFILYFKFEHSCAGLLTGIYGPCEVVLRKYCTPLCCVDYFCFRRLRYSSCLSCI